MSGDSLDWLEAQRWIQEKLERTVEKNIEVLIWQRTRLLMGLLFPPPFCIIGPRFYILN